MYFIGSQQYCLALFDNLISPTIMDILRSQEPDTGVVMLAVVPTKERLTE
jgi:hypothetical protein